MIDPNEVVGVRRALGRQLARYRQAAGLNQHQLAPHTHYGRSTVANVEIGRQNVPRGFWERADAVLGAGGKLLQSYDQLQTLVARQRWEVLAALSSLSSYLVSAQLTETGKRLTPFVDSHIVASCLEKLREVARAREPFHQWLATEEPTS